MSFFTQIAPQHVKANTRRIIEAKGGDRWVTSHLHHGSHNSQPLTPFVHHPIPPLLSSPFLSVSYGSLGKFLVERILDPVPPSFATLLFLISVHSCLRCLGIGLRLESHRIQNRRHSAQVRDHALGC